MYSAHTHGHGLSLPLTSVIPTLSRLFSTSLINPDGPGLRLTAILSHVNHVCTYVCCFKIDGISETNWGHLYLLLLWRVVNTCHQYVCVGGLLPICMGEYRSIVCDTNG